jgi:hypothetical protein
MRDFAWGEDLAVVANMKLGSGPACNEKSQIEGRAAWDDADRPNDQAVETEPSARGLWLHEKKILDER